MSESRWLVACDLDQTLIYSRAAFRLPAGLAEPPVVIVEYLDGKPLSHLTERAYELIGRLASTVPLVPVTTRTLAQYSRVDLGFQPAYAIAANGGRLIVDGRPDPGWESAVRRRLAEAGAPLADIQQLAEQLLAADDPAHAWVRTMRGADDYFLYLVATERAAIPDLADFEQSLEARGWTLSVQGRKVYLVPAALTKEAALAEVVRRTGNTRLAAAGDSLLDLGMLTVAEVSVRPAHGELHERATAVPGRSVVTSRAGLLAGEEVLETLLQLVGRK